MSNAARPTELLQGAPLPVHLMAEQEYCEVKVDLRLRYPRTDQETRALPQLAELASKIERGIAFHDAMSRSADTIHPDVVARLVASGRPFTLVETLLEGAYDRLRIVGRPDAIHFGAAGRAWLVEFKVREHAYPTPSDDAQLRLYGYLLLRDRRFKIRELTLVCAFVGSETAERTNDLTLDQRNTLITQLCRAAGKPLGMRRSGAHLALLGKPEHGIEAVVFPYDPDKALSELRFMSEYWLGRRAPVPTLMSKKCATCAFNALHLCAFARAPFSEITP